MFKRIVLGLLAMLLMLAAAVAVNTWRHGSRQLQVAPLAPMKVDEAAVAERLAQAVRLPTVSSATDAQLNADQFRALHALLQKQFPRVHASLKRELVNDLSLLYTWEGSDPKANAIVLLAHQDVVPIAPGTESLWKKPPFAGVIEDGMVWGRGTLDNKSNLVTQMEAVELLLKAGFKPRRTVYLIAGHDEEVGGQRGALAIVDLFRQRGVKLEYVIDEGLAVTEGILPGVATPLALIGLAEKGSVSIRLTAQAAPGHSSMPPAQPGQSAIAMLSAALARLDRQPMPGGVQGAAAALFTAVAPELPFGQRLALSNLWLLRPVVEAMLGRSAATNAMMRTTTAMTMLNAGIKDNVLPGQAEAVVNFRILPGDTAQGVAEHVKRSIADERIVIQPLGVSFEASSVSSPEAPAFRLIERTAREVFPDALVAPGLMLAGSDARHFQAVAHNAYRFMPIRFKPEDLPRVHGTDERISVLQLADMVRFYHRLLQQSAQ